MIEHTIDNYADISFVSCFYKMDKICIIAQTTIHKFIVFRIITVGSGFKQRPDVYCRAAKGRNMGQPLLQLSETVGNSPSVICF